MMIAMPLIFHRDTSLLIVFHRHDGMLIRFRHDECMLEQFPNAMMACRWFSATVYAACVRVLVNVFSVNGFTSTSVEVRAAAA